MIIELRYDNNNNNNNTMITYQLYILIAMD